VDGVDPGCLLGVQVSRGDPFDAACGAHADGETFVGD